MAYREIRETFVTYHWNLYDKSQKAICTNCWWHQITIFYRENIFEMSAIVTNCVPDPLKDGFVDLCERLLRTDREF